MMFLVDWKEKKNMFKKLQDYQGTAQCQLAKLLHLFERSWHAPNHHPILVCAKTQSFANEPQGQVVTASGWLINRQICQRLEIEENVSEACKHVVFTLIGRKCLIFSNHIASLPGHWLALRCWAYLSVQAAACVSWIWERCGFDEFPHPVVFLPQDSHPLRTWCVYVIYVRSWGLVFKDMTFISIWQVSAKKRFQTWHLSQIFRGQRWGF